MAKKLTARKVEQARANPHKRIEIPDGAKPGLHLVIQPSGKKSWAVRYRFKGQTRKLTLDGFPSLATARKLAQEALDKVAEGFDPAAEKQAAKREGDSDSNLFGAVAAQFVERHAKRNTRASSASQTEAFLAREVLPKWGNKRIQDITKRNVLDLLDGIIDRGSGLSANRVLAVVRKLFSWAVQRGIVEASPVTGIKAPLPEPTRDRVLSDDEIRWLWLACDKVGYPFGAMAKLLLLTGQRRNEVAGMTWGELDLDKALWRIPGGRTKNDEAHEVPLSDAALAVIASLPRIKSDKGFLFTTNGETHVSGYSRAKAVIEKSMLDIAREERGQDVEIPRWTFHDLRRTAVSGMARLSISLPVIEKVVNHSSGSFAGIVGVYQRHSFADEKRTALEAWGAHVMALVEGRKPGVVLPMRGKAGRA
jgi:integrase